MGPGLAGGSFLAGNLGPNVVSTVDTNLPSKVGSCVGSWVDSRLETPKPARRSESV